MGNLKRKMSLNKARSKSQLLKKFFHFYPPLLDPCGDLISYLSEERKFDRKG